MKIKYEIHCDAEGWGKGNQGHLLELFTDTEAFNTFIRDDVEGYVEEFGQLTVTGYDELGDAIFEAYTLYKPEGK